MWGNRAQSLIAKTHFPTIASNKMDFYFNEILEMLELIVRTPLFNPQVLLYAVKLMQTLNDSYQTCGKSESFFSLLLDVRSPHRLIFSLGS